MRQDTRYIRLQLLQMAENLPQGYTCTRRNPYRAAQPLVQPQLAKLAHPHGQLRLAAFH